MRAVMQVEPLAVGHGDLDQQRQLLALRAETPPHVAHFRPVGAGIGGLFQGGIATGRVEHGKRPFR